MRKWVPFLCSLLSVRKNFQSLLGPCTPLRFLLRTRAGGPGWGSMPSSCTSRIQIQAQAKLYTRLIATVIVQVGLITGHPLLRTLIIDAVLVTWVLSQPVVCSSPPLSRDPRRLDTRPRRVQSSWFPHCPIAAASPRDTPGGPHVHAAGAVRALAAAMLRSASSPWRRRRRQAFLRCDGGSRPPGRSTGG